MTNLTERGGGKGSRPCEQTVDLTGAPSSPIHWSSAAPREDGPRLDPWRRAVGPVRFQTAEEAPQGPRLRVVVWNARVGAGALDLLWSRVCAPSRDGAPGVVVLLQEVFSHGVGVPDALPGMEWASRISDATGRERADIVRFARDRGLTLLYVPSMRNGGPEDPPEDRGNAILSNLPLTAPRAIELPFERQRRVAVSARVRVAGAPVTLCSVHLDNRAPWRRAWRSLGAARERQMRGLLDVLGTQEPPRVLGGDFNTWVRGRDEGAYIVAEKSFASRAEPFDTRPTHRFEIGGVLRHSDHVLFDLPGGWHASSERLDDVFGSDHYPLIGTLEAPVGS